MRRVDLKPEKRVAPASASRTNRERPPLAQQVQGLGRRARAGAPGSLLTEPQHLDHVAPDEAFFQDVSRVRFFSTENEGLASRPAPGAHPADARWDVLERPTSVQLVQFVHADGDPGWAGEDDAGLGRRVGGFRHARNRPAPAGGPAPFLGARQLWWPMLSAFEAGVRADRQALEALLARGGHALTLLAQSERFLRRGRGSQARGARARVETPRSHCSPGAPAADRCRRGRRVILPAPLGGDRSVSAATVPAWTAKRGWDLAAIGAPTPSSARGR